MKLQSYFLLIIAFVFDGCYYLNNKNNHLINVAVISDKSVKLKGKLYLEHFTIYKGYMTSDINAEYLTDSVNFRKYLGDYDSGNEQFEVKCIGNTIEIVKTSSDGIDPKWSPLKVLEHKTYSLENLKRNHQFE